MKSTYGKISSAFRAIVALSNNQMPIMTSLSLYKLKNAMKEYVDFGEEQVKKIANEVGATVSEDGRVIFKSAKERGDFLKKVNELDNIEVDIDITPVPIKINSEMVVSANDIEALEGFVTFTE